MRRPIRRLPSGRPQSPAGPATPPPARTAPAKPLGAPPPPQADKGLSLSEWTDVIQKNPDFPGGYAERGAILYKEGRLDNALYDFNKALKLDPNHVKALFWRGWLQLSRRKNRDAAADFQRAAAIETKGSESSYGAALALHRLGELDASLKYLDQALSRNPDHAKSINLRGRVRVAKGEFEAALPDLDRALAADPRDPAARTARARASVARGNFGRALEDLAAALEADPKFADAFAARGLISLKKREHDAALAEAARAQELDPQIALDSKYGEAFSQRARRRLAASDEWGAAADFEMAWVIDKASVDPGQFADALRRRARAHVAAGRGDEAVIDFDAAQELLLTETPEPGHAEAILRRGLQRLSAGKADEALADLDRALTLGGDVAIDPAFAKAYGARGTARLNANDTAGGMEDLTRAISLAPSEPEWRTARARAFLAAGDVLSAAGDSEILVKISNTVPGELSATFVHRAGQRMKDGDVDGAVADYRRALRFHPEVAQNPDYAAALRARAEARVAAGKSAEALDDLDELVRLDPATPPPAGLAGALVHRAAGRAGEAALADLDRAIVIDPSIPAAWEARGILKESRMDYADAREDLRKAVELDASRASHLQPLIAKLDDLLR